MHKNDRTMIISGIGVTILALVLAFVMGSFEVAAPPAPPATPSEPSIVPSAPITQSGTSDENTEQVISVSLSNPVNVTVTLTWTDEPDGTGCPPPAARWVNQPDNFGLTIEGPGNATGSQEPVPNTHGQQGSVSLSVTVRINGTDWSTGDGEWSITVLCGACGDQTKWRPGVFGWVDSGNAWEMSIEYSGYDMAAEGNT